jgi:hypothetical protein
MSDLGCADENLLSNGDTAHSIDEQKGMSGNDETEVTDSADEEFDTTEIPSSKVEHDFVPNLDDQIEIPELVQRESGASPALVACPQCHTMLESWQPQCHNCGREFSHGLEPDAIDVPVSAEQIQQSFADWFTQGAALYKAGLFSQAQNCFNEALVRAKGMDNAVEREIEVRKNLARTLQKLDKNTEAAEQYMILSTLLGPAKKEYEQQAKDISRSAVDVLASINQTPVFRDATGKELRLVPLYCANCKQLLGEAEVYGCRNGMTKEVRCLCGFEGVPIVRIDAKHLRALKDEPTLRLLRSRLLDVASDPLPAARRRGVAIAYAICLGWCGAHKFYLGETFYGAVYAVWFAFSWLLIFLHLPGGFDFGVCLLSFLPWVASLFQAVHIGQMSRVSFNLTYNIESVLARLPQEENHFDSSTDVFSMEKGEEADADDDFELQIAADEPWHVDCAPEAESAP